LIHIGLGQRVETIILDTWDPSVIFSEGFFIGGSFNDQVDKLHPVPFALENQHLRNPSLTKKESEFIDVSSPLTVKKEENMKQTTDFLKMKKEAEKVTMLTAYDYPSAKLTEEAGMDIILVGDSLGMVVLGYDSTIPVTVDDMIHHTKAVKRGAPNTFIVTDMPFMTYHLSREDTLKAAARIVQESGANAVKVEGAGVVIDRIQSMTGAGIPVMAHLGLTPQSVGVLGGYKVQGKTAHSAQMLLEDAIECEKAGAFSIVLECVPKQLAKEVSEALSIPVIGIGAGNEVDGQVLVFHDLVTYGVVRVPKFVKQYSNISETITSSLVGYREDVKSGRFPEEKHSFTMREEELQMLYGGSKK
jgi:3-methyl-2-oxobutanoate hydroxymethyltransferase